MNLLKESAMRDSIKRNFITLRAIEIMPEITSHTVLKLQKWTK